MAIQVLITFENDAEAKSFVQEEITLRGETMGVSEVPVIPYQVCGVWKSPTIFCDPSDGHRGKKTEGAWTRGKKYGWWVCSICGKPSAIAHTNISPKWEATLGTNLLPPEVSPEPFKHRLPNWTSPMEWRFLVPEVLQPLPDSVEENSDGPVDAASVTTI